MACNDWTFKKTYSNAALGHSQFCCIVLYVLKQLAQLIGNDKMFALWKSVL